MPRQLKTLEDRIEWLIGEVLLLREDLGSLVTRVEAIEHGSVVARPPSPLEAGKHADPPPKIAKEPAIDQEEEWAKVGQEVLLPRVAAVSFMLVVALILRTVTDNGMIALQVGSLLGMGYAVALIGVGFYLYTKKSRLSPVFPTCGTLLLFAIIFESHVNFSYFSATSVHIILLIAEIIIIAIGLTCNSSLLLFLAVIGSSAVGFAIGFPTPIYSLLGALVLMNCVGAHLAASKAVSTKLRWLTLFIAIVLWTLWSYKLNFVLQFEPDKLAGHGVSIFLPLLFSFWAFFTYTSLRKTLESGLHLEVFYNVLPAIVAGGTFFAANAVLKPWIGKQQLVGISAVIISACYIGLVAWLARREDEDVPGGKEFVTAATILLIQGMAITLPPLLSLPVWAVAAGVLTVRSGQWHSGGIRVISYLFQIFILIFAIKSNSLLPTASSWPAGLLISCILSVSCLWLYRWCRNNPPDYDSVFFTLFDKKDYFASVLLMIGVFQAFCFLRFGAYGLLNGSMKDIANAFMCAQSIIVNFLIIVLMLVGLKVRKKEIMVIAGSIVLIAAVKVFLLDLFKANGLPLVLSVFSFGVVAAVSSVVMRKWKIGSPKKIVSENFSAEESVDLNNKLTV